MHPTKIALFTFILIGIAASNPAFAHVTGLAPDPVQHVFDEPREVVKIYLKAVERGELIVFDQPLDPSMISPVRVEYVYELDVARPRVKVYSELRQPMPVPGQEDCRIHGVGAVLDTDGTIIETEAHVWPGQGH